MKLIRAILTSVWAMREQDLLQCSALFQAFLDGNTSVFESKANTELPYMMQNGELASSENQAKGGVIAVIPIKGIITKEDFCGSMGMKSLDDYIKNCLADETVSGIILDIDSGGGQGTYLENVATTIQNANKPIMAYVSGFCCSAAYYIASNCGKIYVSAKTDLVGSIGTMYAFQTPNPKNINTPILHTIYASKSTEKNKIFDDASEGKYSLLRTDYLDPVNEVFHDFVKAGRPSVSEDVFTGKTYYSEKAEKHGLIDGIKSFDDVIAEILEIQNNPDMFSKFFKSKNQSSMSKQLNKISAAIGREFKEGDTLTAEELATLENSLTSETSAETTSTPTAETPVKPTATDLTEAIQAAVSAGIAPIQQQLTALNARLETVEGTDGSKPAKPTPGTPQNTDFEKEPWKNPNLSFNKKAAAFFGE